MFIVLVSPYPEVFPFFPHTINLAPSDFRVTKLIYTVHSYVIPFLSFSLLYACFQTPVRTTKVLIIPQIKSLSYLLT